MQAIGQPSLPLGEGISSLAVLSLISFLRP